MEIPATRTVNTRIFAALLLVVAILAFIGVNAYSRGNAIGGSPNTTVTDSSSNSDHSVTTTNTSLSPVTTTTTTSASTGSSTTTESSSSVDANLSASSTGNACFTNGYNSNVSIISSYYYECSATLSGNQSIKQLMLRSSALYGNFELGLNSSRSITVTITESGIVVFSKTGTFIQYSGVVSQNELMGISMTNAAASNSTYQLGLDFRS
jgi:hypothetical protein